MIIDCEWCEGRGHACGDCVVTVLLGGPPAAADWDDEEQRALAVLADSGLVPPLRLSSAAPTGTVVPGAAAGVTHDTKSGVRRVV